MAVYPRESTLEKYIKDFVYHNTSEKVELYLQDEIIIKPLSRKGSIIVGIFWSNVLQCDRNFPPYPFVYQKKLNEELQEEALSVTVGGVTFTVYLTTGKFTIKGDYIYEWFTKKFQNVLNNFDVQFGETWRYEATPVKRSDLSNGTEECRDMIKTETEKYLLMENTRHQPDEALERKLQEGEEDLVSGVGNLNMDQVLFTDEELTRELNELRQGGVCDGLAVVYKTWKSLLNKWFLTEGTQVYLCTPVLDSPRLRDVIQLFLQHRALGDVHSFYVSSACDPSGGKCLTEVQKCALSPYSPRQQTAIQYRLLRKMVQPARPSGARFIAAVSGGQAEVLLTSAGFHSDDFTQRKAHTAWYTTLSEEGFMKKYIEVLQAPNATTTY